MSPRKRLPSPFRGCSNRASAMASGFLGVILAHSTLHPMIPMINVQSALAAVVNTVGPFERPCETEFGRDSTDCAQISPLLELLDAAVLSAGFDKFDRTASGGWLPGTGNPAHRRRHSSRMELSPRLSLNPCIPCQVPLSSWAATAVPAEALRA